MSSCLIDKFSDSGALQHVTVELDAALVQGALALNNWFHKLFQIAPHISIHQI